MPAITPNKRSLNGKKPIASRETPRLWGHTQIIFFLLTIGVAITLFISVLLYSFIALDIPGIRSIATYRPAITTTIYNDRNEPIDRIYTENRILVDLKEMPHLLPMAFVSAEDSRFFEHGGVDAWSIARALLHNLQSGDRGQGGSTITQQVAKSLLLSPEKTYTRKIKEAILAYRIDKLLTKEEIIHIYLNQIYLGEGAYGVEAASQTYFGKKSKDLNLSEMTILAGLPQAPSRYSPIKNLTLAKKRQVYVLNRMAEDGYITGEAAREAYIRPLYWAHKPSYNATGQYFLQHVKNYVRSKYGNKILNSGGLQIYTTNDASLQEKAEDAITQGRIAWAKRQNDDIENSPQSALISIDNMTGAVKSLVGGNNFKISQFDRATQARRQPGSAFKPIIYTAALNSGFTPNQLINDEETHFKGGKSGQSWIPRNFSGKFYGPTTLRNALVHSRNIVTIKILQEVGIRPTLKLASALGIHSPLKANLALALGSAEISPLELTAAYTVFASHGIYRKPFFIEKILDRDGNILEKHTDRPKFVLNENVAFQITHLLQGVIKDGTGKNAQGLRSSAAGKTGTTDHNMDAWFIGYTPHYTTGVWVGFDKHKSIGKGETGGRTSAPIWLQFMKEAEKTLPAEEFSAPSGITFIPINKETGDFEYIDTDNALWEAFRKDNLRSWKNRLRR